MLLKYDDFLNESALDFILEANIQFSHTFKQILDKGIRDGMGDSTNFISKVLLNAQNKEIDVNTNYFDIPLDEEGKKKTDTITYLQDDRVKEFKITNNGNSYTTFTNKLYRGDWSNSEVAEKEIRPLITNPYFFPTGSVVKLIKVLPLELLNKMISFDSSLYLVGNEEGQIIIHPDSLEPIGVTKTEAKIGRVVRRILTKLELDFTDSDIENFVNGWKSMIATENNIFDTIKIVSGEDIRKYYNYRKYINQSGSLGSSCMRYDRCDRYFGIYVKNPKQVRLAVMLEPDTDLVRARALLWTDIKGREILDRVYATNDSDTRVMIDWAISKGFYYKIYQNFYEDTPFVSPNGVLLEEVTIVQLENYRFDYYPYLDTLKFLEYRTGRITNDSGALDRDYYTLTDTEGGNGNCETCGGRGSVSCEDCDGEGEYDCRRCDGDGDIECRECDGEGEHDCGRCAGEGVIDDEDCPDCGGSGKVNCSECDGSGRESCPRCDGDCRIPCDECGGDGYVSCPDCN